MNKVYSCQSREMCWCQQNVPKDLYESSFNAREIFYPWRKCSGEPSSDPVGLTIQYF